MTSADLHIDLPEARIALAYCPPVQRAPLGMVLALDQRLARLVARTSEPMLGQMRLAWWREVLRQTPGARPRGDEVIDAISQAWPGPDEALIALVDGWEELLRPEPLDRDAALRFAEGRAGALVAAAALSPEAPGHAAALTSARVWALADLAAKVSDPAERAMLIEAGREVAGRPARVPRAGRALAVLGALGRRALTRGGRPLMEGRSAAAVAAKAAILLR